MIGIARGDKRSQMLGLRVDGNLVLVTANNAVPLAESIGFRHGKYSVDVAMIRQLVDSATTADPRYTPSARREARKGEEPGGALGQSVLVSLPDDLSEDTLDRCRLDLQFWEPREATGHHGISFHELHLTARQTCSRHVLSDGCHELPD